MTSTSTVGACVVCVAAITVAMCERAAAGCARGFDLRTVAKCPCLPQLLHVACLAGHAVRWWGPFHSRNTYWDSGLGWRPSGLTPHRRGCRLPGSAGGDRLFPKPRTHEWPLTASAHALPTVSAVRGQSSRPGQCNRIRWSWCGCRRSRNCTFATAHVNPNRNHQNAPRVANC